MMVCIGVEMDKTRPCWERGGNLRRGGKLTAGQLVNRVWEFGTECALKVDIFLHYKQAANSILIQSKSGSIIKNNIITKNDSGLIMAHKTVI